MSRNKLYSILLLGTLLLIYISSFVDRQIIAVLATGIREELGLNNTQVGVLYGPAFSLIYAVCGLVMGYLADRYSRKYIILSGLTIWSMMTLLSGFATSFAFLISARLMVGVSQSALSPAVYSLLADYFGPEKRARVFSVYASGIFIGVGLSFLIGGSVAEAFDWRTAIKSVGWPGLILAVLGLLVIREPKRDTDFGSLQASLKGYRRGFSKLVSKPVVRFHLAGFSLLALSGYTILAFISTVLTDVYNRGDLISYYGWFMMATALSVNVSGWLADRLALKFGGKGRFGMGVVAALGGLPFYILGFTTEDGFTAFLWIGLGNVISSSYNGVAAALIQYFVGSDMRATAGALYLFVVSVVGFGIGPPLTGWLIDHVFTGAFGPNYALLSVFGVCGALATLCFVGGMRAYDDGIKIKD
ncbi:spinster family MFS transporter [Balneola sp. MJW-20]|uniref:spinster family MFS transporter n=1 Tax=Gracilimonas aurantiaca TaxID=3234185 RepID=UPI0034671055